MYLEFFDLTVEPFAVTPDPDFLYFTPGYREALAAVVYGVEQRKGFITLVGEVGTGKTTILRASLAALQRRKVKPIYIFNAGISFAELVKTILREPDSDEPIDKLLNRLHGRLVKEYKDGNNIAVIIDEAQNMTAETMESLRMLSNMETNKNKLLQIVLAGQPELDQTLERHELRQVRQRIAIRAVTGNLDRAQSLEYIRHRVARAGQDDLSAVFDRGALNAIAAFAKGNPRVINMICDNALVSSYGVQQSPVSKQVVKEVIAEHGGRRRGLPPSYRYAAAGVAAFAAGVTATFLYNGLPGTDAPPSGDAPRAAAATAITAPALAATAQTVPAASVPRPAAESASAPVAATATAVESTAAEAVTPSLARATPRSEAATSAPSATAADAEPLPGGETTLPEIDLISSPDVPRLPQQNAGDAAATAADTPPAAAFPIIKVVRRGDSLSSLARTVYGFYNADMAERLKRFNPTVENFNVIQVGDELLFPDLATLTR